MSDDIRRLMHAVPATASSFSASHVVLRTGAALPFGARVQLELPTVRRAVSPTVDGIVRWVADGDVGVQLDRPGPKATWALRRIRGKRAPITVRLPAGC